MKTSIAIAPMLLAASAYAGAALFIKECAGGQALIYFKGWAFNGGLLNPDDFDHTAPSDEACELEGSSSDATCYKRGYKFHLSETSPYGCNHANHVTEGQYCS